MGQDLLVRMHTAFLVMFEHLVLALTLVTCNDGQPLGDV